MATSAFIGGGGNVTFKVGNGATPTEVFTAIEEMQSMSGLGQTNETIEVTHFASAAKEYIGGFADGQEITVQCNKVQSATIQDSVLGKVQSKASGNVQVVITDGTTSETYAFSVAFVGWSIEPQINAQNTITFTMKISGDITIS